MKRLLMWVMLAVTVAPLGGCVVEPARPVYRAAPAYGCDWVPAHYNVYGAYIPGHCRH